jgi:hypothetical protein
MDYTLALYHQDKLEKLSIELTLTKLLEKHGYPEQIRSEVAGDADPPVDKMFARYVSERSIRSVASSACRLESVRRGSGR